MDIALNRIAIVSQRGARSSTRNRTAATAQLIHPYQPCPEHGIDVWLKLTLTHADAGESLTPIANDQPRVNA